MAGREEQNELGYLEWEDNGKKRHKLNECLLRDKSRNMVGLQFFFLVGIKYNIPNFLIGRCDDCFSFQYWEDLMEPISNKQGKLGKDDKKKYIFPGSWNNIHMGLLLFCPGHMFG